MQIHLAAAAAVVAVCGLAVIRTRVYKVLCLDEILIFSF